MTAGILFSLTYLGIACGRLPGLAIDRTGIALLGAIAMVVGGVMTATEAFAAIDIPTILLLYSLMVISAQLRLGGFYAWSARRIIPLLNRPRLFLAVSMLLAAALSALLANDIVCLAFTPVLIHGLVAARLNPVPFLLGLALASNIGSAATIIGNPQNMLIGQSAGLDFNAFFIWCLPPSLLALAAGYLLLVLFYRRRFVAGAESATACLNRRTSWPEFNRHQTARGLVAIGALIALFFTPVPREVSAIGLAGLLLCSRRYDTRRILGLVDWHLITLFCALFIVVHGVSAGDLPGQVMAGLQGLGIHFSEPLTLAVISAVLSNIFSNVPAVMLLIQFLDPADQHLWYVLAVSSTFAGNFILLGSIANLIVVEQALAEGVVVLFAEHARIGIPVTLASLTILAGWIAVAG
ncbi:MAG: SLC13 family permease [Desulfoprunum sp.]|uniref:SLC13 family permease n=1 Tax=Desulfoprunum sp. TaxID=2020866 RepID=UPI003C77B871